MMCPGSGHEGPTSEAAASRRTPLRIAIGATLMLVLGALSSCSSSARRADPLLMIPVPDQVTVTTTNLPGLGNVLTDASGHTLYMFPIDLRRHVACTGGCAGTWPPLVIAVGHHPTATGAAKPAMLGTLPDPNTGAKVVTYAGNPLYRYDNDTSPHMANGQDITSDGGPWYALTPTGRPITTPIPQGDTPQ